MGGIQRRKRTARKNKTLSKRYRMKRFVRQDDQIIGDLDPTKAHKLLHQKIDYDLPGKGQFYCVSCAKHFRDLPNLEQHRRGKPHKRKLKKLKRDAPYSQAEADAAGGMGPVDNGKEGLAPGLPAYLDDEERAAAVDALETVTRKAIAAKAAALRSIPESGLGLAQAIQDAPQEVPQDMDDEE